MDKESLPKTRKEAMELGYKFYFTGKPCKNGHIEPRKTKRGKCLGCQRKNARENYQNHRNDKLEYAKQWRENNPEYAKEYNKNHPECQRKWRENNREKHNDGNRQWRENNPDYYKKYYEENREKRLERSRKWSKENPERKREIIYNRKASKMQRTPIWADREEIRKFYKEAERLTKETGIIHQVDHYYPLQGKTVSGLHVAENLQIITKVENSSKNNAHPDDYYSSESSIS